MGTAASGIVVLLVIFTGVFVLLVFGGVVSRFYRRCGADEALVRTGQGGNHVVIGGGVLVYPILHQLQRVSLRSVKLSVERSSKNALVTADKIKANVTTELYIKVEPIAEDVLAAARSFGDRNMDEHAIGDLIEGKLTDALRSVAANQTFMDLHGKRKEFAEHIQAALAEELKKNGLTLENVSITALAMVPVKELDEHDVFDAEGLRAITESVQTNREKTNQITRDKELQIQQTNVEARMKALHLEQQQKQAEADQARKVAEYGAAQQAETAKAVYVQEQSKELGALEKQKAVETARIQQEQAVAIAQAGKTRAEQEALIAAEKGRMAAEIAKQREIEAATIEKEKVVQAAEIDRQTALEAATVEKEKVVGASLIAKEQAVEVARINKEIAITRSQEEAARAGAAKAIASAEMEKAQQAVVTVETTAKAEREKAIQVIQAQANAEVKRALAEGETSKARALAEAALLQAKGEASVVQAGAEAAADKARVAAQGEADRARIEAEGRAAAAAKEAEATMALADALARRGVVDADNKRLLIEAENALGTRLVMRDIAIKALEVMPEVTRELMAPAAHISEIKVLQTGGGGNAGALGAATPILKTILEAGAAYPLVKELMNFAQTDPRVAGRTRELMDDMARELGDLAMPIEAKAESVPPAGSGK